MSLPAHEDEDVPGNGSAVSPLLRSLSKSNPRNPTQKLHPTPKTQAPRTEDDIKVQPQSVQDDQSIPDELTHLPLAKLPQLPKSHVHLELLPVEVLENIAGYLVGSLGSSNLAVARNWNEHMRHPRRKDAGNLALVSRVWRGLIQERLYRHIKVQGTTMALDECRDFLLSTPHLQNYVRHLQVISPIWEMKAGKMSGRNMTTTSLAPNAQGVDPRSLWTNMAIAPEEAVISGEQNHIFQLASCNATVEEIFSTALLLFPKLSALTIEAGHCKRPPQMLYFRSRSKRRSLNAPSGSNCTEKITSLPVFEEDTPCLPQLPNVTALIIKGAWNVIRTPADFEKLSQALPCLREFSCSFHALKTQAYATMNLVVRSHWPDGITHLNITLDGLYTKASSGLKKWRKIYPGSHICPEIASRLPNLISLTYTGRVCYRLFDTSGSNLQAGELPSSTNKTLRSIDLVVNNLCCDPLTHSDATGIHHLPFINGFERLIFEAVLSFSVFVELRHLRIRFIDIDSPNPLLNPTFHLDKEHAWGMWSDRIVAAVANYRPEVQLLGRKDALGVSLDPDELQEETRTSTSVESYRRNANSGVLIH